MLCQLYRGLAREAVQAGDQAAGLDVDVVAVAEQPDELVQSQPPEVGAGIRCVVRIGLDDEIAVARVVEAPSLLRQQALETDAVGTGAQDVVEEPRRAADGSQS